MKRIVTPQRWSMVNRVEHPPMMMKQLVQGVCGGLRWLEAKNMAEYIAKKVIEDGLPCSKSVQRALDTKSPRSSSRKSGRKTRNSSKLRLPAHSLSLLEADDSKAGSSSNALMPLSGQLATMPAPKLKRLITYDVLDCTLGGGYHAGAILENGRPYTRVVALDCDTDATLAAREMVSEFGSERFRFLHNRMSESKALFGERSFDAVMIDPGPSVTQLEDPERGFLLDDENDHGFDMRYGLCHGVSALEYLNMVPQHTLSSALASYGILTPQQSMKLARAVRSGRPFGASRKLLETIEAAGNDLPEDGWLTQSSRRKSPMSWRFLVSLRCVINNERYELNEALQNALLLLRDDGRLVVMSRLPWEEELIRTTIEAHPHATLCYTEEIGIKDVQKYGHTRHSKMWVATRVKQSSFILKNAHTLTEEKVRDSSVRWLNGMYAGQTHGFPAHNFTFENVDPEERKIQRRNKRDPDFDWDDEDGKR